MLMGVQWGNGAPRPDSGRPMTVAETVTVGLILVVFALVAVWVMWAGGHRVQTHLDDLCRSGSQVGCALDGRHP